MNENTKRTRAKLKEVGTIKDFSDILEMTMLSEEDKQILMLHYKEQKPLSLIADELGLSEDSIKKKHRKMLMKIGKLFK